MRRLSLLVLAACHAPLARPAPTPAPPALAAMPAPPMPAAPAEPWFARAPRSPLDRVALAAARSASVDYVVDSHALRVAMAAHVGSGLSPHVLVAWGTDAAIAEQLEDALAELRASADLDTLGVASVRGPIGRVAVVVAMPPPPLPITVERIGGLARITLAWPWLEPVAAYEVTGAASHGVAAARAEDRAVVDVECPGERDARGTIEVFAGTRMIANVVDACERGDGIAGLADRDAELDVGPPATTTIEREERVFALIARERAARGLPAVAWDSVAQRFARLHARDMARLDYIGHEAPNGWTYAERIAAAPFLAHATHENVGHAWGPGEVHLAFMGSPGHRANLLADDIDLGAVGIVPDPRDPTAFYITEFFRG